ncbi:hypothetical protein G134_1901 [Lactobacillus delbrueckii subsp. lactis CRL581]|nr:hypothetical protein G134_1901 [Lactobacillus delbrueckii subsp. lactis CRL581]
MSQFSSPFASGNMASICFKTFLASSSLKSFSSFSIKILPKIY